MKTVKTILTNSIISQYTICNNVLQYTNESTEAKIERATNTFIKIMNLV